MTEYETVQAEITRRINVYPQLPLTDKLHRNCHEAIKNFVRGDNMPANTKASFLNDWQGLRIVQDDENDFSDFGCVRLAQLLAVLDEETVRYALEKITINEGYFVVFYQFKNGMVFQCVLFYDREDLNQ